jgi:hypothetical protein
MLGVINPFLCTCNFNFTAGKVLHSIKITRFLSVYNIGEKAKPVKY